MSFDNCGVYVFFVCFKFIDIYSPIAKTHISVYNYVQNNFTEDDHIVAETLEGINSNRKCKTKYKNSDIFLKLSLTSEKSLCDMIDNHDPSNN